MSFPTDDLAPGITRTYSRDGGAVRDEPEPPPERNETDLERADRNLGELLQEVRVAQTGVQVLFGFLLAIVFQTRFREISPFQKVDYFVTLLATGASATLLIAPTAYHRILFRRGDKAYLVDVANRLTMIGLCAMAVAMVGAVVLVSDFLLGSVAAAIVAASTGAGCVTLWFVLPMLRRRALRRSRTQPESRTVDAGGSAPPRLGSPGRIRS